MLPELYSNDKCRGEQIENKFTRIKRKGTMYSIKISKGKGLKAYFQASSRTLCEKLDGFIEKDFTIERIVKTKRGIIV